MGDFLVATQTENTPTKGLNTLFVNGLQPREQIMAQALNNGCPHIYLGANNSFQISSDQQWNTWKDLVEKLVSDGIWTSLEFDIQYAQKVATMEVASNTNFVPVITVCVPETLGANYDTTMRFVPEADHTCSWNHLLHSLKDSSTYTHASRASVAAHTLTEHGQ